MIVLLVPASTVVCTLASTPQHTTGPISINFAGTWVNSTANFTYSPLASISQVSPVQDIAIGGALVTFTGSNLGSSANSLSITLGGSTLCSPVTHTATSIVCRTTGFAAGTTGPITFLLDGRAVNVTQNFTFFANPAPASFSPNQGPQAGGITLTITGTGFTNAAVTVTVTVGSATCKVSSVTDTTIICVVQAAHDTGASNQVSVVADGHSFAVAGTYSIATNPTVTSFSPTDTGGLDSSRDITVLGTGLTSGNVTVTVAGCPCTPTAVTPNSVVCTLAATCTATGPVVVSIGAFSATSADNFSQAPEASSAWVGAVIGSILGVALILAIVVAIIYWRRRGQISVKERPAVRDANSKVFAVFGSAGADTSDKTLSDIETQLEAILIGENKEVYTVLNTIPDSENIMKAVGLFIYEKEYLIPVFDYFCQQEVTKSEDNQRLFRGPDVCSRLYRSVLKPITFNYYWNLLGPIIDLLTQSDVVTTTGEKFSRASADEKMMSQADVEMFELNVYKTQLVAHQLVANIMKSKNFMPLTLREILFCKSGCLGGKKNLLTNFFFFVKILAVGRNSNERFGKEARNNTLTTFLVLRFFSAILMTPTVSRG